MYSNLINLNSIMTKTELEELVKKNIKELSKDVLEEVLDFVLFLKEKKNKQSDNINLELKNLDKNELEHLEAEFENYKELYPVDE